MNFQFLKKAKGFEDSVVLNENVYRVRFTPKHAEHILDNYLSRDGIHDIKPREILYCILNGAALNLNPKYPNEYVCLGEFNNKFYEIRVYLEGDCMNVKTAFLSNKLYLIESYKRVSL